MLMLPHPLPRLTRTRERKLRAFTRDMLQKEAKVVYSVGTETYISFSVFQLSMYIGDGYFSLYINLRSYLWEEPPLCKRQRGSIPARPPRRCSSMPPIFPIIPLYPFHPTEISIMIETAKTIKKYVRPVVTRYREEPARIKR